MVGAWPHRPGTLRALITILKGCHIICRPCERYAPLSADRGDLDRPYELCPFVCSLCSARAEIVMEVPAGFVLSAPARRVRSPKKLMGSPAADLGPRHTPTI
ncbi:MAG: hypothetical protein JWR80_3854 [Bradyrhizobium sp.]|nr:hypothetical protein [Bradyrhizobium sp.]